MKTVIAGVRKYGKDKNRVEFTSLNTKNGRGFSRAHNIIVPVKEKVAMCIFCQNRVMAVWGLSSDQTKRRKWL